MRLYQKLSKINFLKKSYAFKFLFVAFIGIHIPLIGMLFYVLYGSKNIAANTIIFVALVMTLIASAVTLYFLKHLIKPIEIASKALDNYRNERKVPSLPTDFSDEAGLLMRNIQKSILENERSLSDNQDLIYLLSHDFKNFTGNSQGLAELILDESPSEIVQEYAQLIKKSTIQQFVFIEIFIKLMKDQEELLNRPLKVNTISLQSVLEIARIQVAPKLISKKIILNSFFQIDEVLLTIEEDLLVRVLVNLIDNAIKFSFPETEIQFTASKIDNKIALVVSDSGIGFNLNDKEELYKRFTTRSRVGTSNEPSTGIGLYLCKKIVEKYQGKLILESPGVNKGSTFSVLFTSF